MGPVLDGDGRTVGPPEDIFLAKRPFAGPEGPEDRAILDVVGVPVFVGMVDQVVHVPAEDLLGRLEPEKLKADGLQNVQVPRQSTP